MAFLAHRMRLVAKVMNLSPGSTLTSLEFNKIILRGITVLSTILLGIPVTVGRGKSTWQGWSELTFEKKEKFEYYSSVRLRNCTWIENCVNSIHIILYKDLKAKTFVLFKDILRHASGRSFPSSKCVTKSSEFGQSHATIATLATVWHQCDRGTRRGEYWTYCKKECEVYSYTNMYFWHRFLRHHKKKAGVEKKAGSSDLKWKEGKVRLVSDILTAYSQSSRQEKAKKQSIFYLKLSDWGVDVLIS